MSEKWKSTRLWNGQGVIPLYMELTFYKKNNFHMGNELTLVLNGRELFAMIVGEVSTSDCLLTARDQFVTCLPSR